MHMSESWIAVVRICILEIYIPQGDGYIYWNSLKLDLPGAAFFSETSSARRSSTCLKLCIARRKGLFVYEVACNPAENVLSLNLVWTKEPPGDCGHILMSQGKFGAAGRNISWFWGDDCDAGFLVQFASAQLPCGKSPEKIQATNFEKLAYFPAIYALGVHDYDEACGILVVGSAYGEVALYDFGSSDPGRLDDCATTRLEGTPYTNQDLMSTVCTRVPLFVLLHLTIEW